MNLRHNGIRYYAVSNPWIDNGQYKLLVEDVFTHRYLVTWLGPLDADNEPIDWTAYTLEELADEDNAK